MTLLANHPERNVIRLELKHNAVLSELAAAVAGVGPGSSFAAKVAAIPIRRRTASILWDPVLLSIRPDWS